MTDSLHSAKHSAAPVRRNRASLAAPGWLVTGALLAATAVALGAYGAHGLEATLQTTVPYGNGPEAVIFTIPQIPKLLASWNTAVHYHMFHALALLVLGLLVARQPTPVLTAAGWAFVAGISCFSGALYVLVLGVGQPRWLNFLVPAGGIFFIVGWLLLAWGGAKALAGRNSVG